jgi:uncharacterized protein YkwD
LKFFLIFGLIYLILVACVGNNVNSYLGYSKSGLIESYDSEKIRIRHLDIVNALRQERGLLMLTFSRELNASADTHAIDISNQKRAWNFGSDASSPQERAEVSSFSGIVRGENVSETFEGEFEVLQVWLKNSLSSQIILDEGSNKIGLGWHQDLNGTIWWVQVLGQSKH